MSVHIAAMTSFVLCVGLSYTWGAYRQRLRNDRRIVQAIRERAALDEDAELLRYSLTHD